MKISMRMICWVLVCVVLCGCATTAPNHSQSGSNPVTQNSPATNNSNTSNSHTDEERIIGTWKYTVDIGEHMAKTFSLYIKAGAASKSDQIKNIILKHCNVKGYIVETTYTFQENGKVIIRQNADVYRAYQEFANKYKSEARKNSEKWMPELAEYLGYSSYSEMLRDENMSYDDFVSKIIEKYGFTASASQGGSTVELLYKLKNGKIAIGESATSVANPDVEGQPYRFQGEKLILTESYDYIGDQEIVLQRVN